MSSNGLSQEFYESSPSVHPEQSAIVNCELQHYINQMFIKCNGTVDENSFQGQVPQYMTRDQLANEVISLSLNRISNRSNSCLYSNNSDDNSSHDSTDFVPRPSKRKIYDQSYSQQASFRDNAFNSQSGDLICEKYSLQLTRNYWKQQFPFDPMARMTEEDRMIIKHLVSGYSELKNTIDESKVQMNNCNMNKV